MQDSHFFKEATVRHRARLRRVIVTCKTRNDNVGYLSAMMRQYCAHVNLTGSRPMRLLLASSSQRRPLSDVTMATKTIQNQRKMKMVSLKRLMGRTHCTVWRWVLASCLTYGRTTDDTLRCGGGCWPAVSPTGGQQMTLYGVAVCVGQLSHLRADNR